MQIGWLEMPAEQIFRVLVDDQKIEGHFVRDGERFIVTIPDGEGSKVLKSKPRSPEGASLLVAFRHFEEERKQLKGKGGGDGTS